MKGLCYCWGVQEFKVSMYPSTSPTVPRLLPWERTSGSGAFCCFQKLSQGCIQDTHTVSCVKKQGAQVLLSREPHRG